MVTRLRLAMIGCGRIADFHAHAFKEVGFDLSAICSRRGSARLQTFADRHGIPRVFENVPQLLENREHWDGLLIAVPVAETLQVLRKSMETGAPIIVEKPIAFRSEDLELIRHKKYPVIVGYNRRFYRTVQRARDLASASSSVIAEMTFPESVMAPTAKSGDPQYLRPYFSNSVHGLDMLRFIFGDLEIQSVQRITNENDYVLGFVALLSSDNGSIIQFVANWQTPTNTRFTLDQKGSRLELLPFEDAKIYDRMMVVEPTDETPIRTYKPKVSEQIALEKWDYDFKPGFISQAQTMAALIQGHDTFPAATLEDAYKVLKLAEELVGQLCG